MDPYTREVGLMERGMVKAGAFFLTVGCILEISEKVISMDKAK
jgi:hypothetical protein